MKSNQLLLADILAKNWWIILLRGVIAVVFGLMVWLLPEISLLTLVLLFGAFAFSDGLMSVYTAWSGRNSHADWWALFLGGSVGICMGVVSFFVPNITALALLFYVAIWAFSSGLLHIVAAIKLHHELQGEWFYILGGLASIVFAVLLVIQPSEGILALLWLLGFYAVTFGGLMIVVAFRMRRIAGLKAQQPVTAV
jgi:uncharacterized membrane protein HdeD (DUF308 family)